MLNPSRSLLLIATGAVLILPLAACAGRNKLADTAYVARDVNTLYAAAKRTMDQGDYMRAAKLFDEVERQHPYSVWARRAQLMSAFNYYLAQKYNEAIGSARRFVTIHPGNAEAPYAQYLISMSYYQQIEDVTRDQSTTDSAKSAFSELIRRYPETRYAADARLKLDLINDHLGGKQMEVGRFYQRSGQWLASTYRFRDVVDNYGTTTHAPEALARLVESDLALGLVEEARKTAAVLGTNYADNKWYNYTLVLLNREARSRGRLGKNGGAISTTFPVDMNRPEGSATSYPGGPRTNATSYPKPKAPKTKATTYPEMPPPPETTPQ